MSFLLTDLTVFEFFICKQIKSGIIEKLFRPGPLGGQSNPTFLRRQRGRQLPVGRRVGRRSCGQTHGVLGGSSCVCISP